MHPRWTRRDAGAGGLPGIGGVRDGMDARTREGQIVLSSPAPRLTAAVLAPDIPAQSSGFIESTEQGTVQKQEGRAFDQIWSHPLIVHIPLELISGAVLFAAIDFIRPRYGLRSVALALLVSGVVLAAASGEAAQHQGEQLMPTVGALRVAGGSLLESHAKVGETTRNVYAVLLMLDGGLLFATEPAWARLRRGRSLPQRLAGFGRGFWLLAAVAGLALIVLTGHHEGTLVHNHGIGVARAGNLGRTP